MAVSHTRRCRNSIWVHLVLIPAYHARKLVPHDVITTRAEAPEFLDAGQSEFVLNVVKYKSCYY